MSVVAFPAKVIPVPAVTVSVSDVESATIVLLPVTAIVLKESVAATLDIGMFFHTLSVESYRSVSLFATDVILTLCSSLSSYPLSTLT